MADEPAEYFSVEPYEGPVREPERRILLISDLAKRIVDCGPDEQRLGALFCEYAPKLSSEEMRDVLALVRYEIEYRRDRREARSGRQRRAMRLLMSFLSPEQQRQMRSARRFHVRGSAGGLYRLYPRTGTVERIERFGRRWFALFAYCLHDYAEDAADGQRIPTADLALQHLLLLRADEPAFLAEANATARSTLWSGAWRRQLREAREQREAAA